MSEGAGSDAAIWAYMDPALVLAVDSKGNTVPDEFRLIGNYPNPFNPATTIRFSLPQTSDVTLEVFNILGQLVSSQRLGVQETGVHSTQFNASNLASGVYNYRLIMETTKATIGGKMMFVK
jgi:hypothetical protein